MSEAVTRLCGWIAEQRERVIVLQRRLTALPALAPENGGCGELAKALYVLEQLECAGITDIERFDAPDPRVKEGIRPNFAARVAGRSSRVLWIMAHLDVVPPGDLGLWKSDPWTLAVEGDVLRGRGVEDNQQALVSGLLVIEALQACRVVPDFSLGLLCVADEECGSAYGAGHVLSVRPDMFGPDDLLVVPDSGKADGSWVQVAEKGMLWIKVTVTGVQCHASRPDQGRNALVAASEMIVAVKEVAAAFAHTDPLFEPSCSTFVPTRREENVPNVNTVPGRDVFYVDCRLLPQHSPEAVLQKFTHVFGEIARRCGVTVRVEPERLATAAPVTSPQSEVVRRLCAAVTAEYGITPRCAGAGGGTVAALFRRHGISAAVWASQEKTAHQANETSRISRTLGDAGVFARMLFNASGERS